MKALRRNAPRLMVVVVVGLVLAGVHSSQAYRLPPVCGQWTGDTTEVFGLVYRRHGISVRCAKSVVVFQRDGTWTSKDSAVLVAAGGPKKGDRASYHAVMNGTFVFNGCRGMMTETAGRRTADGRTLTVRLPRAVHLRLRDRSTLDVCEDYGKGCRYQYSLIRAAN